MEDVEPRGDRSEGPPHLERAVRDGGFRGRLFPERPLAPFTTWRIGGPAELLAVPEDEGDLLSAVSTARERGVAWRVLGNGSNLLVPDAGVPGLVVRLRRTLDEVTHAGTRVTAGAGASLPAVAREAASLGLGGIEFGAGIPGTIGGAIVMNAGWHEFEIGNYVESVVFMDAAGNVRSFDREACEFGYRRSRFRGAGGLVLRATLALEPGEARKIATRLERFAESRKANQPTELPSCGSVFLKPEGDFAGRLIEAAGLKGLRIGDVQVSPKHANFFVNLGGGTAADALALITHVEQTVLSHSGIHLTREVETW